MVAETKKKTGKEIRREISTPQDIEELKSQLENLRPRNGFFVQEERTAKKVKKNLAKRIWEAIKSK